MQKRLIILIIIIILFVVALSGVGFLIGKIFFTPAHVHYHAGFQVYKDGKLEDFSAWQYMHEKPCTTDSKPVDSHEDDQIEKAHLHDQVGDVVHVHRTGATWGDLFKNITYKLEENAIVAFAQGKRVENIFNKTIQPYESIVIVVGKDTYDKTFLEKAVTQKHIEEIEKKSELCATQSN